MIASSTDIQRTERHVAILEHAAAVLLIFGFVAAAWGRLNDCDLFNPDSPRYVIYAQSIANSGQYRAIDSPGSPLYAWRPPGLSILLAPILKFRPYDTVAAKCVVIFLAALLLWMVHLLTSIHGRWIGPLMVAVVGSSPLFLLLSTEVLTEVPYSLGTLIVIYCAGRWNKFPSGSARKSYGLALLALAFTPILRTVGVALIAAVGIWSITSRRRWKFLPAVGIATLGVGWLALRSRLAPGNNYAGSLLQSIRDHGLRSVVANAWETVQYYATVFPGVILPGLTDEQPFYAPMAIGALPSAGSLGGVATVMAWIVLLLGVIGLWQQRSRAGIAALLYLPIYGACLAIWPWRHERFLWPLTPLIWAFAPAGAMLIAAALPQWPRRLIQPLGMATLLALAGWQSVNDAFLIDTNQRFLADRDAFIRHESPGFYFSGWRAAGTWIRENTPRHARLLVWQAAVGGTAHRFQRRLPFETLTPETLHQQIAGFSSRYLVVNDAQFGLGFAWQQLSADPAYQLKIVYRNQNVAVLEVEPNRTGIVSRTAYTDWVVQQTGLLEQALARQPDRMDLLARQAELLEEAGRPAEAIKVLEGLVQRGMNTVRVCSTLGWLNFEEGRYESAAKYLELASGLPNAEQVSKSLADGARQARQKLKLSADELKREGIESALGRVQGMISSLRLDRAEREVDGLLELAPENAAVHYWRGYLHHLFGEVPEAEARYIRALELGSEQARGKLLLLRLTRALEEGSVTLVNVDGATEPVEPESFSCHVRLAALMEEHGWAGRALALLEAARQRFGDRPEILARLADLNMRFARPDVAAPQYRLARQEWPHEKSLRQGLDAAEAALVEPTF